MATRDRELISVYTTTDKARRLKQLAEADGRSLSNFLDRLIDRLLDNPDPATAGGNYKPAPTS
jgi:hypothetical protein